MDQELKSQYPLTSARLVTLQLVQVRGSTGAGLPKSTPAGFCVFLSDPDPESKIWEKTNPESLFHFGSSRSLCGHFLSKNVGKL